LVILVRNLLEILSGRNPVYLPLQFFVHYPLAYLAPLLALALLLHVASGVPLARVAHLMVPVWTLTLLPPLVDLVAARGTPAIGYLDVRFSDPRRIMLGFFDPRARFEGTTAGIRFEAALACLLGAAYVVWRRHVGTGSRPSLSTLVRAVVAAVGIYLVALAFFTLPHLAALAATAVLPASAGPFYSVPRILASSPGAVPLFVDQLCVDYLAPLCLALLAIWACRVRPGLFATLRRAGVGPATVTTGALAASGLAFGAAVRMSEQGALPVPAPLDLLSAAGILLAAVLGSTGARLAHLDANPQAAPGPARDAGFAALALALCLGAAAGGACLTLLATSFALHLFSGWRPFSSEPLRAITAAVAAAVGGLAVFAAGLTWAIDVDALAAVPPRLAFGMLASLTLVSLGGLLAPPLPTPLGVVPWIAAGPCLAIGLAAPARVVAVSLLPGAAAGLLRGRGWPRASIARWVASGGVVLPLAAVLLSAPSRQALGDEAVKQPKWIVRRAMGLEDAGRSAEAIAAYRRALGLDPSQARVRARLGELLLKVGDRSGAMVEFREAARLDPSEVPARQQLGALLLEAEDPSAALGPLDEAAVLAPDDPTVAFTRAQALSRLPGRREQALRAWTDYLKLSEGRVDEARFRAEAFRQRALLEPAVTTPRTD
jgi:Flp pilus assembly protein TadD